MALSAYSDDWVGIDAGREGLWREPIWTDVLRIVQDHDGESVYSSDSPIYLALEQSYPKEKWRSYEANGHFRPLFRDYPNSWTRSGVLSLEGQVFHLTTLGHELLAGHLTKQDVLVKMFQNHEERVESSGLVLKTFRILLCSLTESPRPLETREIYWAVVRNYRPGKRTIAEILAARLHLAKEEPRPTGFRRLRNMLTLLRSAGIVESSRRRTGTFWTIGDSETSKLIIGS